MKTEVKKRFKIDLSSVRYMQYLAALIGTLPTVSVSMNFVWTSPIVPKIRAENSDLPVDITEDEVSWMVASLLLGCIPGILLTSWSLSKFGRKTTLLFGTIPLLIPWFIIAFASDVMQIVVGRFIAGIGIPVSVVPVMLYTCEIADKDIRGRLALSMKILTLSGELYVLIAGPHLSYKVLTLTCGAIPLAFFAGLYYMPESPYYLVKAGKEELAKKNLSLLMNKNADTNTIKRQLEEIKNTIQNETVTEGTLWEFVSQSNHRKSLIIGIGLLSLSTLSGATALTAYMQTIFALSASIIAPETSTMIVGLLELCGVIVSAVIVDKVGRRPLMIVSALGCAVFLSAEGLYFWLHSMKVDVSQIFWLPTVALALNNFLRTFGVASVPFIVLGEIFATNVQPHASTVCGLYGIISAFIVSVSFGPVSSKYGVYVMFWAYAAICILGVLFVAVAVPETKGKSFVEIRQRLNKFAKPSEDTHL